MNLQRLKLTFINALLCTLAMFSHSMLHTYNIQYAEQKSLGLLKKGKPIKVESKVMCGT